MKFSSKNTKRLVSLTAFLLIPLTFGAVVMLSEENVPYAKTVEQENVTPVAVEHIEPQNWQAEIRLNGVTNALNKVELSTEIAGKITTLSTDFEEGAFLAKGAILAKIDDVEARRNLAVAKQALSDAKVNFLKEERKSKQAARDWKRLSKGKKPDSDLVLNIPQLEAAKARFNAAKAEVVFAQNQLEKTKLRSPFDSVVLKRHVNQGQILTSASVVATLQEVGKMQVRLQLNEQKWALLEKQLKEKLVEGVQQNLEIAFHDPIAPDQIWFSKTVRLSGERNAKTRQRLLIADVMSNESGPILPGTFVRASFKGRKIDNVLALPSAALTVEGYFWSIDHDNRLKRNKADVLALADGKVYVQHQGNGQALPIVIAPLSSMLEGQKVAAKIAQLNMFPKGPQS